MSLHIIVTSSYLSCVFFRQKKCSWDLSKFDRLSRISLFPFFHFSMLPFVQLSTSSLSHVAQFIPTFQIREFSPTFQIPIFHEISKLLIIPFSGNFFFSESLNFPILDFQLSSEFSILSRISPNLVGCSYYYGLVQEFQRYFADVRFSQSPTGFLPRIFSQFLDTRAKTFVVEACLARRAVTPVPLRYWPTCGFAMIAQRHE